MIRDLDLRPKGKTSFQELVDQKQPRSNEDKYAVVVYWLKQIAEIDKVTIDHVGTVFRMMGWREPADLTGGLTVTAHRKSTIDTADLYGLKTTSHGRNFVEHDLPAEKKFKKK